MRPASEMHSALQLCESELARQSDQQSLGASNIRIARDVLAWCIGESAFDIGPPNEWLLAFLLDDPPKLDDTPPEVN